MTRDELRAKFNTGFKIIARERSKREWVFRNDPVAREQKLAEMDRLLAIFTELKDFCKERIAPEHEQLSLIDPPGRYE
jgi:hypothetical protein